MGPRVCTLSPFTIAQNSLHGCFGASGDLTIRKLIPALYHLAAEKARLLSQVPPDQAEEAAKRFDAMVQQMTPAQRTAAIKARA